MKRFMHGLAFLCLVAPALAWQARADQPDPTDLFADLPADALMRRLDIDAERRAYTADPSQTLRRTVRRDPASGMMFVESVLTNESAEARRVSDTTLLVWRLDAGEDGRYRSLTHRDDVWHGSTYWTGPDWTRVGKDWHHPGSHTPSIRRFVAPREGRVTVTGRVYKADTNGGDGVSLSILHGSTCVWEAAIAGDDADGVEPAVSLDVRKGDSIRFVVDKREAIPYDTTHWDPVITYEDGARHIASEGFSTRSQGDAGWWYEMEATERTGVPALHAPARDTALVELPLDRAPASDMDHHGFEPLFVLTDESRQSGVAMAVGAGMGWRLAVDRPEGESARLTLTAAPDGAETILPPGGSLDLPRIAWQPFAGPASKGFAALECLRAARVEGFENLVDAAAGMDLDLWAMVQADWRRQDQTDGSEAAYERATRDQIERARRLLDELGKQDDAGTLDGFTERLADLARESFLRGSEPDRWRGLYMRTRRLKRDVALANPLMDFGPMLVCKRTPTSYSHLVMQYFGWRARPGGGLYVVERPGRSLATRDILDGQLPPGNVLEPRLSYDARRIVFSYVPCPDTPYDPAGIGNDEGEEGFYHIYEVAVDGTGLRQLTDGPFDDLMPTYLPDGGIAFCSTRRRGYARCFGPQFSRRWHVYTLHRMDGDGSHIQTLSYHDTNEWFPTVANTGQLLYSRWDYIDRDAVTHQNLWAARPDGSNPVALWGNATETPHCTFQPQPIPGSNKIIFTASAHHSITAGSIAIVDPAVANNGQAAITRITPEIPFPESESMDIREYYAAPWPLSEHFYLVAYSPEPLVWEPGANARNALGVYLLDAFGNRELLYRDPDIGTTNPVPLRPRPAPPVVPSVLPEDAPPMGEVVLADVYEGLGDVPRGSIKRLRVVQIFPKTTYVASQPPIGHAGEENARAVLGTVPVEPDGSARFLVPAHTPILFQALDEDGFAYQTMRTLTYLQAGERVSCVGCHESRMRTPDRLEAMDRPPRELEQGPFEGEPLSFMRVVQPVLDKHCVPCHSGEEPGGDIVLTGEPHEGFTRAYRSLCGETNFQGAGTNPENAARALVPMFGARNQIQITPPGGAFGARGSRLLRMLREGHHDVALTREEFARLAMWIDNNAVFYGAYAPEDQQRELRGERLEMPAIQ